MLFAASRCRFAVSMLFAVSTCCSICCLLAVHRLHRLVAISTRHVLSLASHLLSPSATCVRVFAILSLLGCRSLDVYLPGAANLSATCFLSVCGTRPPVCRLPSFHYHLLLDLLSYYCKCHVPSITSPCIIHGRWPALLSPLIHNHHARQLHKLAMPFRVHEPCLDAIAPALDSCYGQSLGRRQRCSLFSPP